MPLSISAVSPSTVGSGSSQIHAFSTPLASTPNRPTGSITPGAPSILSQTAPLQVKPILLGNITLNKGKSNECVRGVFVTLLDQFGKPMDLPAGWPPLETKTREKCLEIFQTLITETQKLKPDTNLESSSVTRKGFAFTDTSKQPFELTNSTQVIWDEFTSTLLGRDDDGQLYAALEAGPTPTSLSSRMSFSGQGSTTVQQPFTLSEAPSPQSRRRPRRSCRTLQPSPTSLVLPTAYSSQSPNQSPLSLTDILANAQVPAEFELDNDSDQ